MKSPKAPAPPDPAKTAGAQTAQNVSTAIAQSNLNNINQVTPDGALTYNQTGTFQHTDPNTGTVYDIPQYTATQTLSEAQQAIKDRNDLAEQNISQIAVDQSGRIGDLLGQPVNLNNEATEARLAELGRARLDPALDRRREQLSNQLAQQGIQQGSTAYDRAMMRNMEGENDAYNQLFLTGRGQSVQETLAERNQPINEITALLSGSQVSQPNFVGTNPAQLANVDRAGLEQSNYNQRLDAWKQDQAGWNSLMGGLFGLGAAGITKFSDERLKTDIVPLRYDGALPVYSFRYLWDQPGTERVGYMAQDVLKVKPEAVLEIGGFYAVDYGQLPEVRHA